MWRAPPSRSPSSNALARPSSSTIRRESSSSMSLLSNVSGHEQVGATTPTQPPRLMRPQTAPPKPGAAGDTRRAPHRRQIAGACARRHRNDGYRGRDDRARADAGRQARVAARRAAWPGRLHQAVQSAARGRPRRPRNDGHAQAVAHGGGGSGGGGGGRGGRRRRRRWRARGRAAATTQGARRVRAGGARGQGGARYDGAAGGGAHPRRGAARRARICDECARRLFRRREGRRARLRRARHRAQPRGGQADRAAQVRAVVARRPGVARGGRQPRAA